MILGIHTYFCSFQNYFSAITYNIQKYLIFVFNSFPGCVFGVKMKTIRIIFCLVFVNMIELLEARVVGKQMKK